MIRGQSRDGSERGSNNMAHMLEEIILEDDVRRGRDDQLMEDEREANEGTKTYYNVEKILDKKICNKGVTKYKIKWEGWPESKSTWEPVQNLENVSDLIANFEEQLLKKTQKIADNRGDIYADKLRYARSKESQGKNTELIEEEKQREIEDRMKNLPEEGHLKYKDRPKRIVSMKFEIDHNKVLFLIEWYPREDGRMPQASYMSNEDFKAHNPVFLLEFYESRMVYLTKKRGDISNNAQNPVHSTDKQSPLELEKEKFISDVLMEQLDEGNKNTIF